MISKSFNAVKVLRDTIKEKFEQIKRGRGRPAGKRDN